MPILHVGPVLQPNGIGRASRNLDAYLRKWEAEVISVDLYSRGNTESSWQHLRESNNLLVSSYNPDLFGKVMQSKPVRSLVFTHHYSMWSWELRDIPKFFITTSAYIDGLFAYSSFMRTAFDQTEKPISLINPLKLEGAHSEANSRPKRKTEGLFIFGMMADARSGLYRKNLKAGIDAFSRLSRMGITAALNIKISNSQSDVRSVTRLVNYCSQVPNVSFELRNMSTLEMDHWWSGIDCLISLHRAEGFGFNLLDAVKRGLPVVTSEYGGPLDFVGQEYLVSGREFEVNSYAGYAVKSAMFEPSVEHAEKIMCEVIGAE